MPQCLSQIVKWIKFPGRVSLSVVHKVWFLSSLPYAWYLCCWELGERRKKVSKFELKFWPRHLEGNGHMPFIANSFVRIRELTKWFQASLTTGVLAGGGEGMTYSVGSSNDDERRERGDPRSLTIIYIPYLFSTIVSYDLLSLHLSAWFRSDLLLLGSL